MTDTYAALTTELVLAQRAMNDLCRRVDTLIEQERRDLIELRKQVDLLRADFDATQDAAA